MRRSALPIDRKQTGRQLIHGSSPPCNAVTPAERQKDLRLGVGRAAWADLGHAGDLVPGHGQGSVAICMQIGLAQQAVALLCHQKRGIAPADQEVSVELPSFDQAIGEAQGHRSIGAWVRP